MRTGDRVEFNVTNNRGKRCSIQSYIAVQADFSSYIIAANHDTTTHTHHTLT